MSGGSWYDDVKVLGQVWFGLGVWFWIWNWVLDVI